MHTRAVLFDLDGTLLDTLEDIAAGCNEALRLSGYEEKPLDFIRMAVGNGFKKLMERTVPGGLENPRFQEVYEAGRAAYARHAQEKTHPYDGIIRMMEEMLGRGISMGIVSNKPDPQVKELSERYFSRFVPKEAAVGENEDKGIRRKPWPDSVRTVMDVIGASPDSTVYAGDSDVDILTARNAGIPCISVTWGFRSREFLLQNGATLLAGSPQELLGVL